MAYTQPLITSDVGDFSPYLRMSAETQNQTRNVVHELLGGGVAVTFGGDTLATSSLEMLFTSETDCLDAYTKLNTGHIFQLTDYVAGVVSVFKRNGLYHCLICFLFRFTALAPSFPPSLRLQDL